MAGSVSEERRAFPRISPEAMAGIDRARLRPGRSAHVVDLSPGGALIEADWRLLPGMRVEIQVGEPVTMFKVAGKVLRCHVALLDRERIRYRGALKFEQQISVGEMSTHGVAAGTDGPQVPQQSQDGKQIPG
jgi:hypothetical protein